jgi:hypothetical protein
MKILHQAGHNTNWNLESYLQDGTGDGIIFSPVHYSCTRLEQIESAIREVSYFDPQFYVPGSQKNKLLSYDFFPEKLMEGFSTSDFEAVSYEAAELCLDFQMRNEFEALIIPARYFPEMVSDYISQQRAFTVEPFLAVYNRSGADKQLFLTLPLTSAMILDTEYRTNILNWITAYPEIDGIYLLVNFDETTKQCHSFEKLHSYTLFIHELQEAELKVICGYCNTEGVLLTALNVFAVAMGAYENTRGFSIDKFLENDQDRRGPAPRIFLPRLLNWIRWDTAMEIREDFPDLWERIYIPTDHAEGVFHAEQPPHFTQPPLYKHHFKLMFELYDELRRLSIEERKTALEEKIRNAAELYEEINRRRIIFFDINCTGEHLPVWNRVLRRMPI